MARPSWQARLDAALNERDAALLEVATLKEQLNAIRLAAQRQGEVDPPNYPAGTALGAPPTRYVVADAVSGAVKKALGPLHGPVKSFITHLPGFRARIKP